jgi:hypothetical protein
MCDWCDLRLRLMMNTIQSSRRSSCCKANWNRNSKASVKAFLEAWKAASKACWSGGEAELGLHDFHEPPISNAQY